MIVRKASRPLAQGLRLLLVTVCMSSSISWAPAQADDTSRTFLETGKSIHNRFLQYWDGHGGLLQQGYPISEEIQEVSDSNGKSYTVQYFERAVFELHSENAPPNDVLLSLLGVFLYKQKYTDGAPGQQPGSGPNSIVFPETGKHLGGKNLEYWKTHGGLPQYGYPISDVFSEISDLNEETYPVQYFERAVFEFHPENAGSPYEILLSQLGTHRHRAKYGSIPSFPLPAPRHEQVSLLGSDNYLVWVDEAIPNWQPGDHADILALNLRNNRLITVTEWLGGQGSPSLSGSTVIWIDNGNIYGMNLGTGKSFDVAVGPGERSSPVISGTTVAWYEPLNGGGRIMTKDLDTGEVSQFTILPTETGPNTYGSITLSDEYVVWQQGGVGRDTFDLLLAYNRTTRKERVLRKNPGHTSGDGQVHYMATALSGHHLAYAGDSPSSDGKGHYYGLVLIDLDNGKETQLYADRPVLNPRFRGNTITWQTYGGEFDGLLWGMNITDRIPVLLTPEPGTYWDAAIAGSWLVYRRATDRYKGDWRLEAKRLTEVLKPTTATTSEADWTLLRHRPLKLSTLTPGERCVKPSLKHSTDYGIARGDWLVSVAGLGDDGIVPVKGVSQEGGWLLLRVTWVRHTGGRIPVLVRGRQLDGAGELRFGSSPDPEGELKLRHEYVPSGQQYWPSYVRIRGPGCYGLQVDSDGQTNIITFQAVESSTP